MCSAVSEDLVTFTDQNKTLVSGELGTSSARLSQYSPVPMQWPSEVYDSRGVFDGTVVLNGFEGYPSILYTATTPLGPLGATVNEIEGVENQAIGKWI